MWKLNDNACLYVSFCGYTSEEIMYGIEIQSSEVYLKDYTTNKTLHEYKINYDGTLGEKTI